MEKSIFKLVCDGDKNDSFRLSVEFGEYNFKVTIFKKSNAWSATVKREAVYSQAKNLEIEVDEYVRKLEEYLKNTPSTVALKFNNNDFVINCTLENNMKVIYFSYKLEKVNYNESVEHLIEKFYTERNDSMEKLKNISKEKIDLEQITSSFQEKLNEFIERKKTEDKELFSNFVLVLNEKKKRIQHLTELLEAFRRGRPALNPSIEVKKRSKKSESTQPVKKEKQEVVSDSEEDYDTDEEKSKKPRIAPITDVNENDAYAIPSTSKFDLFADNSPPRLLPKRIKSEPSIDSKTYAKPSTSKEVPKNENGDEKLDPKTSDDSPNVNFNTQELLDLI